MKKYLSLVLFLIHGILFCQNDIKGFNERYFVGDEIGSLKGKTLVALPKKDLEKEFGYSDFYEEFELKNIYKKSSKYYSSNYDDIANKKFLLSDVKKIDDLLYPKYILTLIDEEDDYVYFKYDVKNPTLFPFITEQPIELTIDYCSKIDIKKDKFTNIITKRSPASDPVCFIKDGSYYLRLITYGSTPVVDGNGVIILLSNGKKIIKSTEIDVDVEDGKYEYRAFIRLNKSDIDLLSKYAIEDFKLYIFENTQKLSGEIYKEYLKCIIK
ncbi:hypothetical protein QX233_03740 [Chryseobacterium gambrini]|uniref:Uncharacterized protein n=1 Tax=Chryseobacterium gambrini TaxID=373672 RepID=A0AAJ1R3B6_9FLAO|nr:MULTISPECIES: hypothetical protein [Chryseobacterium]MDN4011562.1 hypothetical protein [Chryseobacterium gambrini]MDN4029082.1 hypothetical protein [Chryseobacterium gambrini]QWA39241.1 hypothetical protein KKI44_03250 [Chryseobacterium sp. ZHDP1]